MEKKEIISTDYSELEALIKKEYRHLYEIMPSEEVGSSQYAATYTQHVSKGEIADYDVEEFDIFKSTGKGSFILSTILQDMCNKDLLEAGEYIIDVNW